MESEVDLEQERIRRAKTCFGAAIPTTRSMDSVGFLEKMEAKATIFTAATSCMALEVFVGLEELSKIENTTTVRW